jgi:hypothetical protein
MNLLDENISDDQRQLLRSWGVITRQIGQDIGRKGLLDDAIIPLLHQLPRPTFFTRDDGFDRPTLCHRTYCLVYLAVGENEAASFVRRFLRHPAFATFAQRRGTVARVGHTGVHFWRLHHASGEEIPWSS